MTQPGESIKRIKDKLGPNLTIMGHHYQNDSIIQHVDLKGDSLELARKVSDISSKHIVFCGVYFMAESAALLAGPDQSVHTPSADAKCVMSEMAPVGLVERVLDKVLSTGRRIIPLTYVNSSAAVKAVCGRNNGAVCTSANADRMLEWALAQGEGVLFLPDRNLALNTAAKLSVKGLVLDIRSGGDRIDPRVCEKYPLLVWPGCCATHFRFRASHIRDIRKNDPGAKIIVHPECPPEVVELADDSGSTSKIIKYCDQAEAGSTVYVGTELNLVLRLAKEQKDRIRVRPLLKSICSNMAKTDEPRLAGLLEAISGRGEAEPVRVPEDTAENARLALARMLEACS